MAEIHPTAHAVQASIARAVAEGAWRKYDGPCLDALRSILAKQLGCAHVRLCCSGTFAVELALRSLHLSPDAEVLLAGYDFPGNFRAVQDAGATACLCDVAENAWIPSVQQLEQAVGPKTKVVIVSHLHGTLAPMSSICDWAKRHGLVVIEDACQAHGAMVDGKPAGAWGDVGVFSFGGSKLVAAGRGGAVVTNNPRLAQRMTIFCERGNDAYALSELQAAAIVPQYEGLSRDHAMRCQRARELTDHLAQVPWLTVPKMPPHDQTLDRSVDQGAFYKFGLMVHRSIAEWTSVQPFVQSNSGEPSGAAIQSCRAWVLSRLQSLQIEIGEGFRGFTHRSLSRCRQPVPLPNSRFASEATMVLHHSHLLDPLTGESTITTVKNAFDTVDLEIQS